MLQLQQRMPREADKGKHEAQKKKTPARSRR
jgi:hypothetical protein